MTELVDSTPDDIGITADLLGHADLRTTTRHYIKAKGMTAHMRVQDMIAARRRAAATRGHMNDAASPGVRADRSGNLDVRFPS